MIEITDMQKIGVGLSAFGISFLFLGMLLLFDKGLLAIGNILLITGVILVLGCEGSMRFFFMRQKWKGTSLFFVGIFVVLMGWPLVGMIVEFWGLVSLFGGFLPVTISFLRRIPIIGILLNMPGVRQALDRLMPDSKYPV